MSAFLLAALFLLRCSSFGAGPLHAAVAAHSSLSSSSSSSSSSTSSPTWERCVPGCVCQRRDVEETRMLSLTRLERREAHLFVGCTRGHNITLHKFFVELRSLHYDLSQFIEVTLENLLAPILPLSSFARFPRLSLLNLPHNRISKLVVMHRTKTTKTTKTTTTTAAAKGIVIDADIADNVIDEAKSSTAFFELGSRKGRYLPPPPAGRHENAGVGTKAIDNGANVSDADDDVDVADDDDVESFLSRLVSVDLRANSISRLDKKILSKMTKLETLDLSSNNLHFVAEDAFDGNHELRRVYLQDNFITMVPKTTFHSLSNVQILDLSRNQIFSIHPAAFSRCNQLRHLLLSSNLLSHFPRLLLELLSSMTRISINNNPFECACGMEWLLQLLQDRRASFESPDSLRCATPPSLADRPLTSLHFLPKHSSSSSSSELPCVVPSIRIAGLSGLLGGSLPGTVYESLFGPKDPPLTQPPRSAVVFVRADAEFDCVVDSSTVWPRPSILWELPSGDRMAAVPHAHHIPKRLVDEANITDFKTILMKPLDSQHSVKVIPPGILRLTDFRFPMAGNYTCHAISPAGNVSATIRVDIQSAVWNVYISSLFISFATVAISIVLASAVGLVVLLVTHFENKKLQSVGLDGTPPIYPTPEESPQLTHRLLTIPVNAAMFENIKDGYDSFRSKIKTGLDKRMEKGRLLVELAWVSGETAITGLKEGTSTGIHKIDHVVRESGVALTRGIRSGGAAVNKSIRESSAVVSQAVVESVSAVKDNVLSLKELCGGVPSTASVCGETPAIDFPDAHAAGAGRGIDDDDIFDSLVNHAVDDKASTFIQVHLKHEPDDDDASSGAATAAAEEIAATDTAAAAMNRSSKVNANGRGKLKNPKKLEAIAEDGDGGGGRGGEGGVEKGEEDRSSNGTSEDAEVS